MSTEKTQKVRIIFDRVKKIKGFDKDTELADFLGVTKQTLASWEVRGRIANVGVFTDKGYSEDWVRTGEGSVYKGSEVDVTLHSDERCRVVNIYNMVEAGSGTEPSWHDPIDSRAIPECYLKPGIRPVLVRGRSMEPTLKNGAIIGINENDKQVISGEAYAVLLPYEGAVVKRLYMIPDGIIVRSDNKEFPEVKLMKSDVPDYFILGRVTWVVQEV